MPLVNAASLSINDVFIINDSDRGDGQTITSGIKYSDVIGSIASQDINFTGDIVFSGDVVLNGTITPSPGKELNITLDNVTINDSLTINAGATISGIKLSDLDDTTIVSQTGNQLLIWDQGEQAWRNFTLQQIVDNVEDLDLENINNIEMTGDLTMDGDLSVGGDLSLTGDVTGIGLNDLDDVRTPLPITDGRFLRWEQDIQQWIPATISIDDIGGGIANPPEDGSVYGRGFVSGNYEWIKAAPIDSPVFEGTPTCPVPTSTDTGLSIVNKQYVSDILTGEIGGISLDTLDDVEAPNPGDGDALVWNTAAGAWIPGGASTVVLVDTSANKPTNPTDGLLWFNTDAGILYVWEDNNANWIDVRPGPDSVIQAQGYDYDGVIKIEDLGSAGDPNPNDTYIVETALPNGDKVTLTTSWQQMTKPLTDRIELLESYQSVLLRRIEELERRVG